MTPEQVQRHLERGTLMNVLSQQTSIVPHPTADGRVRLEIVFPTWYTEYVSVESQAQIEALIRANALAALSRTSPNDSGDDGER